jgi:hypothetical protein
MRKEAQTADANAAKFVEVVRARAPRGFCAAIWEAAGTAQMTPSKFIRATLSEKLRNAPQQHNEAFDGL